MRASERARKSDSHTRECKFMCINVAKNTEYVADMRVGSPFCQTLHLAWTLVVERSLGQYMPPFRAQARSACVCVLCVCVCMYVQYASTASRFAKNGFGIVKCVCVCVCKNQDLSLDFSACILHVLNANAAIHSNIDAEGTAAHSHSAPSKISLYTHMFCTLGNEFASGIQHTQSS